jgi:hypothetical protein
MSTNPGHETWADAGLVPPDSSAVPDPGRTTVPVPAEDRPRAPKPDLRDEAPAPDDEAPEADALEQAQEVGGRDAPSSSPSLDAETPEADALEQSQEVGDDESEEYPHD